VQNERIADARGTRCRWAPAALISFSDYWEHGASLAVWLVLAAAETRSVGRNRCFYSPAVAVSWFEKAKPAALKNLPFHRLQRAPLTMQAMLP
jgi:hypothetical protein